MSLDVNSSVEQELKGMKIEDSNCDHRTTLHGICTSCNLTVDKTEDRPFKRDKYIKIIQALYKKKQAFSRNSWIEHKKLHLVLDLDHTVIHGVQTSKLSGADKYHAEEEGLRNDLWRFKEGHPLEHLIKLRPYVHEFLRECNEMFCMSVYTKASHDYAQFVLKLIDPENVYFGDRLVTRRESPSVDKTLDLVFADKRGIVIVDDTRSAWPDHNLNLLEIARYNFFRSNKDSCSQCGKQRDESDEEGPLANVLSVLKEVHKQFFSKILIYGLDLIDVRTLLQDIIQKKIGCGCVQ